MVMCDRQGAIYEGRDYLNAEKQEMARISNRGMKKGAIDEVIRGADVFIDVSAPDAITQDMVRSMAKKYGTLRFEMKHDKNNVLP